MTCQVVTGVGSPTTSPPSALAEHLDAISVASWATSGVSVDRRVKEGGRQGNSR